MPKLSMDELAVQYGFAAAFFNQDPELKSLIQQATSGQWSAQKFQAKFMATNWYRWRQASARQWADLTARDPAEAADKVHEKKIEIADRFAQLGIEIDDAQLQSMATSFLQYSFSDAAIADYISGYITYTPGDTGGEVAGIETTVREMSRAYGVTVSDSQMEDWIRGVVSQRYTEESLTDFIRDMARTKYTGMSGYLDAGMTVRQVAAPYLQEYAQLLEVNPDMVNLDDPLIAKALQGQPDPKTGMPAMQSLYEFGRQVRKDPAWLKTTNARASVTDATMGVLKDMGLYA